MFADDQRLLRDRGARRVQVQRLVRLHRSPGPAVRVPHEQGDRSVRGDQRAAHGGDPLGQVRQPPRGSFVDSVVVGDHPGGLGTSVPVLDAVVGILERFERQGDANAAGKPERVVTERFAGARAPTRGVGRFGFASRGTCLQVVHRSIIDLEPGAVPAPCEPKRKNGLEPPIDVPMPYDEVSSSQRSRIGSSSLEYPTDGGNRCRIPNRSPRSGRAWPCRVGWLSASSRF